MESNFSDRRRKAIIKRRIFIISSLAAIIAVLAVIGFIVIAVVQGASGKKDGDKSSSSPVSSSDVSDNNSEDNSSKQETDSSKPDMVKVGNHTLDANYTNLMLVNADNPLPDNYDSDIRKDLVEIDKQYRNNDYVTQIHKDVYPYITAMVADAQSEGVDLRVWSPFRSYAIQKDLFQRQVNRVGGDEEKAATVVARPGTSEHNTGLCADFNMADDAFENTEMYRWMSENAEKYGFIMRYSKEKQPKTGVIHESWHWRFVGIKAAKEINSLGMCLEEYIEYKNK